MSLSCLQAYPEILGYYRLQLNVIPTAVILPLLLYRSCILFDIILLLSFMISCHQVALAVNLEHPIHKKVL